MKTHWYVLTCNEDGSPACLVGPFRKKKDAKEHERGWECPTFIVPREPEHDPKNPEYVG